jgi:hypothetical protein
MRWVAAPILIVIAMFAALSPDSGPTPEPIRSTAAARGAPQLTGISPDVGTVDGGTQVTLTGANLTGAIAVWFGDHEAANVAPIDTHQVTVTTPRGTAGKVDVRVIVGGNPVLAPNAFGYADGRPWAQRAWDLLMR